ncbi:MAG: pitrilysin family protein [Lentilitoribacter sp.]
MNINTTVLPNGLTIVTEHMPHLESVALGVWIKAGSRDETDQEHGIAHLLEHMAFKGTKRRSARTIAEEIENVGGEVNASTSTETTAFYARMLKEDVPLAIDILADILTHSVFDEQELMREKHVILQEIGAANDTPDDVVFDKFSEAAFKNQSVGRPILGTPETVQGFEPNQIRAYMDRNYSADRLTIVAVGAVDHDEVCKLAQASFSDLKPEHGNTRNYPKANYTGGAYREKRDLMDAHILLGFQGRAYHVRDFYASQILAGILGGGMSSRLFQEVRERHGLCYSVYAFHWGFSDSGIFGIQAATGADDIKALVPVVMTELAKIAENIDQQEIDRARAQIRSGLLMTQESPAARAGQLARQMMLFGRLISNEELMERLENINTDRLTDLAGRLFFGEKITLSAVGPIDQLVSLEEMEAMLESPHSIIRAAE